MAQKYIIKDHLGGYVEGGDDATIYPELWTWLVKEYGIKSVLDIGCGEGISLKTFRSLGCTVAGVEGIEQSDPDILQHDFTHPIKGSVEYKTRFDLAWCCEFVEHVEEKYIHNVVSSFQAADIVLLTHARPGQAGYHHVNCRDSEYWKGFMAAIGFSYDDGLTTVTRGLAGKNISPWNHYVASGMAFRKIK